MENVVTPVNVDRLEELLKASRYDVGKTNKLVNEFRDGFSLGYAGNLKVKKMSPNLKLTVGNETVLWNKVMKEVKLKCFAGPYHEPPFEYFIQSPNGLVPKDSGRETRLIFHLSYPRSGDSVNSQTPKEPCTVNYCEFDEVMKICLEAGICCFSAKSDIKSAFRNLGMKKLNWPLLTMKARSPFNGQWYFFIDKCLPFGSSISCTHFQDFSNAVAHIFKFLAKKKTVNYLDDFFFAALLRAACNAQVELFLSICADINFPVSMEKTCWASQTIVFLRLLIDTIRQIICIPKEKIEKLLQLLDKYSNKRKIQLHELQKLCGFLNFLCRAIVPGRAFTRRHYAKASGN